MTLPPELERVIEAWPSLPRHIILAILAMEQLFVRGFVCPPRSSLSICVQAEWTRVGPPADPVSFATNSVPPLPKARDPEKGTFASAAGAREEWLAIHEAAHAIIVLKAGITLRSVRYCGDGFPGETGFEETGWQQSDDEALLQSMVRISVAANIAELMHGHEPEGGYPSRFFDNRDPAQPGQYPSDVTTAWEVAKDLAIVRFEKAGIEPTILGLRALKRVIMARAEAEAERILLKNADALSRLAEELRRGPVTGAAERAIVEG
jgi:hypothetical protein